MVQIHDLTSMVLLANGRKIEGRTTVQKIVYFYTQVSGDRGVADYVPYFYGPFSPAVASALDDLSEFAFAEARMVHRYYETYEYELTKKGEEMAKNAKRASPEAYEFILKVITACKEHCNLKAAPLSCAAKAHHILKASASPGDKKFAPSEIEKAARRFNWKISKEDVESGTELLRKLDLAA